MKLGDRDVNSNQLLIITQLFDPAMLEADENFMLMPCVVCGEVLVVGDENFKVIMSGANASCLRCALRCWPDMIAGRDPDTGRLATLNEIVNSPTKVGAYCLGDIKDI